MPDLLTIGKAAQQSGLTPDSIRYYERLQLVGRPRRSSGGYRLYDGNAVERLRLIRRARAIGFSLGEIHTLFTRRTDAPCAGVRDLLTQKIRELDEKIAVMKRFRDSLYEDRECCDRALARNADSCPLFVNDQG